MKKFGLALLIFYFLPFHLVSQSTVITIQADKPTANISSTMWGIFFEDINLGADGGLYAEMVKNRSFEFAKPLMGWTITTSKTLAGFNIGDELSVINELEKQSTNPRFLRVTMDHVKKGSLGLANEGFRGMGVKKDLAYDFSIWYRQKKAGCKIYIDLVSAKGDTIGSAVFTPDKSDSSWHKGEVQFKAISTDSNARMQIWFEGNGRIDVDNISLFPGDTWKGRKGGLRADMVQMLADMKPGFIRFPGGCIVEGRELASRYQWKKTLGPVENRKLLINRWNNEVAQRPAPDYFQSFGLGFYEYFQLAEDVGAQPLPILNCGMACQFNTAEQASLNDIDPYLQDALDLIEFANGDQQTVWGKIRIDLGHPEPFHLKMLGIGNENWGSGYIERWRIFQAAIKSKYPEIRLVCSSGFMPNGELFEYLNKELRALRADLIDEHYYSSPSWFLQNANRYDRYDRNSVTKVFVGEYAAQSDRTTSTENKNNWRTALAEAAFLTGLERNADIVRMASYAPLFGNINGWQWKPDLIWVDNLRTMATPNYFVQKLYGNNKGNMVIPARLNDNFPLSGQDSIYVSSVIDSSSKEIVIKLVNLSSASKLISIQLKSIYEVKKEAILIELQNDNLEAENTMDDPSRITPIVRKLPVKGKLFPVSLNRYSFTILRIPLIINR